MPVIWLQYTNKESGGRIPVMVEWGWNVLRLKQEITSQLSRIPATLIFSGRVMYNNCKLQDLSIIEFSTVYCVLATPNGVKNHGRKSYRALPSPNNEISSNNEYIGISPNNGYIGISPNNGYIGVSSNNEISSNNEYIGISHNNEISPNNGYIDISSNKEISPNNELMGISPNNELMGISPNNELMGISPNNELMGISPNNECTGGIGLPDIRVEVEEGYVKMRSQEPYYEPMRPVGRDGMFDFSFRRYLADTNSTQSEHLYESMEPKSTRIHFSVFCGDVCKDVTQGKLRVRCYACKSGRISLSRDPSCWSDVTGGGVGIGGVCCNCGSERARAEFYFKCANHSQLESVTTPLRQVKMNDKSVECIICAECPDTLMVFECPSLHVTCLACFKEYVTVNLVSRQFRYDAKVGYSIGCPAGCPDSLITDTQHFRLVGAELYERLQRFAAEEFVLAEGGVLCPAVGCGEGVLPDSRERLLTCETCCHMFCRRCLRRGHFGVCESSLPVRGRGTQVDMRGNKDRSSWRLGGVGTHGKGQDMLDTAVIKSCPGCNVPVTREGGCAHITCGIGVCGLEWCWLCGKEWNLECREDHWFD